MPQHCAIFLCGGNGSRMHGCVDDKIFAPLAGTPALAYALRTFEQSALFGCAVFVFRDAPQREKIARLTREFAPSLAKNVVFCVGGNERKNSVFNGLSAAKNALEKTAGTRLETTLAFIHDGARPFVPAEILHTLAETALREGGATLAHRCKNTVKRLPAGTPAGTACLAEDLDRARLWETETPQVFPLEKIFSAYKKILAEQIAATDDVAAAAACGVPASFVENPFPNPKITTPDDLALCEALLLHRHHHGNQ